MAPSATDPNDIKLILNLARRKALVLLITNILSSMRKSIEQSFEASPTEQITPIFNTTNPSRHENARDPEELERQRRLDARMERSPSTPRLNALRDSTLAYFDQWTRAVRNLLQKTCGGAEDPRSEQRRREWSAARNAPPPTYDAALKVAANPDAEAEAHAKEIAEAEDISMLQKMYPPIPTRLTTISKADRICVVSCMVLSLLSLGHYSAHSRVLLLYITSSLEIPMAVLTNEEIEVAKTLMLASKELSADAETQQRQAENASARRWKVGLASVAGAAVIGITGGIAAPIVAGAIGGIMGGVGLGGVASFLGIFAMNGALVGTLFGAFGGKMTGEMVDQYAKEVSDFRFLPLAEEWGQHGTKEEQEAESRRLRVTIGINGWLNEEADVFKPWRILGRESEVFALRYEMNALIELGKSLENMVSSYAFSYIKLEILKRTVLATLWSALWPVYLLKMATSIDNPFAVARNRSEKAGEVLADALINKAQGERPVTLIGYSLGSRVIYSCLKSLAQRKAFGLVESVILIGSPVPSNSANWRVMRSVVSGKIYNVYSENDYILAFLYRATSIQFGVAGLQEISDVEGIDNLDLTKEVSGHLRYPELVGKILKRCGVEGVKVDDSNIEGDVSEISLVDLDEDLKAEIDAKGLSDQGILELIDGNTPLARQNPIAESSSRSQTDLLDFGDEVPGSNTLSREQTQMDQKQDHYGTTSGLSDMLSFDNSTPLSRPAVTSRSSSSQQDLLDLFGDEVPSKGKLPVQSQNSENKKTNQIPDFMQNNSRITETGTGPSTSRTQNKPPAYNLSVGKTHRNQKENNPRNTETVAGPSSTPMPQYQHPSLNPTPPTRIPTASQKGKLEGQDEITTKLSATNLNTERDTERERQYDSESDNEGGIQMIDNDSDGELQMMECIPEPEPEFDDAPAHFETSNTSSTSRGIGGRIEEAGSSSSAPGEAQRAREREMERNRGKRVRAADLGLY